MSQTSKRIGSSFELDLLRFFREHNLETERLRLTGTKDEGDLIVRAPHGLVVVEAKAERSIDLPAYIKEAELERGHYAKARGLNAADVDWIAVVKARGKSIGDAYVVTSLKHWIGDV